ncbi:unnamed protein product [Porites evermanni]|uniref:Uncharacterized protein n=1 Tax=Porites evermanni TaxID=104178 RepID=A0ABN8SJP0_9CNID|nr:unnamed protein product [Porites evermanni]
MKKQKHNSTKLFPGIAARKPQLLNNSWAKLLSEQTSGNDEKNSDTKNTGLNVSCERLFLKVKETKKTVRTPFLGKLENCVERSEERNVEKLSELRLDKKKIGRRFLHNDEDESSAEIRSSDGILSAEETSRAAFVENKRDEEDHLPPLGDCKSLAKTKREKFDFPKSTKSQRGGFSSGKSQFIDWQKIFVNGGFRPYESRDLPTRGEINLLKYKTWNADEPINCVTKCAKYFGLDCDNMHSDAEKLVKKEPQKLYSSPSPTYKFFPFQASKLKRGFAPEERSLESPSLRNQSKAYNLCNSCIVPPATPVLSMIRYSPIRWSPLQYVERGNTLEELAELSTEGQTTDEGIHSPNESELELQGIS